MKIVESILRGIKRPMSVNGTNVTDVESIIASLKDGDTVSIILNAIPVQNQEVSPAQQTRVMTSNDMRVNHSYIIKVREYMTKPSSPDFDFHAKWNNNIPMPFRIMKGRVLKETRGMVMMDCIAVPLKTDVCIRCGRPLTHPVSRLYGIGPECGGHAHINPFDTEEELFAALDKVKEQLSQIKWRGWIIKSAIIEVEEVRS